MSSAPLGEVGDSVTLSPPSLEAFPGPDQPPCVATVDGYQAHQLSHYQIATGWGCRACEPEPAA
jgi:hypothetical protein